MILAVSLACLTACSKDNGFTNDEARNVKVKFNVQTLNVDVQPMAASKIMGTRATASEVLTNIHYALKNTTTGKWYSGEQTLASAGNDFGNVDLWIPAGMYDVTFFGYGTNNATGSASMQVEKDYNKTYVNVKDKDSFIHSFQTTIADANTPVGVNLLRLNGRLVVKLNDVIPSEIKKIKVRLAYYPRYDVALKQATYESSNGFASIKESYLTVQNSTVDEFGFFMLAQSGISLTLSIFDESDVELGSYSTTVSVHQNKRTIVQGNILDVINQKPFDITVSDEWDTDINVPLQ